MSIRRIIANVLAFYIELSFSSFPRDVNLNQNLRSGVLCGTKRKQSHGRLKWSRDPNMLRERKQLDKWRKDMIYGWFNEDFDADMFTLYDPLLCSLADPHNQVISSPRGVLNAWFGHKDLDEDQKITFTWDIRKSKDCKLLFEIYGNLVDRVLSDDVELRCWDDTSEGYFAKILLLGPIGEAVQIHKDVGYNEWKKRQKLACEKALICFSLHKKAYSRLELAYVARPLLVSSSRKERLLGAKMLGEKISQQLHDQVKFSINWARNLKNMKR